MSKINKAQEAIAFQNSSQLAADLITIFQKCIDVRKEQYYNRYDQMTAVVEYFMDHAAMEVVNVVKKHTNMNIAKLFVSEDFDMGFACMMKMDDDYGITVTNIINRYSGLESDSDNSILKEYLRSINIKPLTADDMLKVAEAFDKQSGKLTGKHMFNRKKIEMFLYFDPYTAFLAKELGYAKFEHLTAEEITAIVLHEIGHMLSMLEHCADHYFKLEAYNAASTHFTKEATKSEKAKYVKECIAKDFNKKVAEDDEFLIPMNDGMGDTIFGAIGTMFITLFVMFSMPFVMLGNVCNRLVEEAELATRDIGKKRSDFASTRTNTKTMERLSDEYVARHGLSGALVSSLAKLTRMSTVSYALSNSSILYYINKLPWLMYTVFTGDCSGGGGLYDRDKLRAQQAMLNTLKVFKNGDMPPKMLDLYIKDYEATKAIFKNPNLSARITEGAEALQKVISYLINPSSIIQMISSGRFNAEYDKLSERVDRLVSNKLLYRAAKLEQLLNRNYKA